MPNKFDVVNKAREWKGVRWRHQGRNRKGVDCAGLVIMVAKELGISNYDTTDYQRRSHGKEFLNHFKNNMKQKPISEAEPGDVLIFRDKHFPCHSAIVADRLGTPTIVHAYAGHKKVWEDFLTQDWCDKRVACFEFYGLET